MAANLPMSAARLKFIHFHYAQPSAAAFFPFFLILRARSQHFFSPEHKQIQIRLSARATVCVRGCRVMNYRPVHF
jgi:hypothetical protein